MLGISLISSLNVMKMETSRPCSVTTGTEAVGAPMKMEIRCPEHQSEVKPTALCEVKLLKA